ncbi:DNA-binding transcriptional regulator LsrR, DeoR family [Poseidonocella pacifica]|uniref:DNA-binding transcriptional regulator LsrR, DeoR family n=1 Tax=Poseidonocella pacifica TaxID=871651 RepID=A0A1I0VMP9_9RHOB|nr:sugar-binding domain-containing protein [Poseidonocella pacifica]SFA77685.1 DNA-binding transcriptional regulator LsrR, DeoR family [Poseidonocella pacifica]
MAREPIEDSDAFVTEVCWHYYVNEMTQAEIARMLDVTRLRVNQAIQRAKSLGFVKVHLESPFLPRIEMQENLKSALGLRRAVVSPSNQSSYDYHRSVGAALAALLTERLATGQWKSFGVSWGLTLDSAIRKLSRQSHPGLEVVSILGGTAKGSTLNSFGIASGFANVLGAEYSVLTAPIYLSEGIDRAKFLSQYALKDHFEKFETLDAVLLTCSNVSEKSFLVEHGLLKDFTPADLIAAGAIGDVLGHFLDKDGHSVSADLDNRTVGMPLEQVLGVPEKIMAAAGPHKVEIIKAACRRGLVDTLVTDDTTARLLLEADAASPTTAH